MPISDACTKFSSSFFANSGAAFPHSYYCIWNAKNQKSTKQRAIALLNDYTKENSYFGSFFGCLFTGHWNRHHTDEVIEILNIHYESVDDLLARVKEIGPAKEGSLARRIAFIEHELNEQYSFPQAIFTDV
jgi:hypothetical protein